MTVIRAPRREIEAMIGKQVRALRLDQGIAQEDLARRANVGLTTLRALEAGRGSSLGTLVEVARALGREEWLLGFHDLAEDGPLAQMYRTFNMPVPQRAPRRHKGGPAR